MNNIDVLLNIKKNENNSGNGNGNGNSGLLSYIETPSTVDWEMVTDGDYSGYYRLKVTHNLKSENINVALYDGKSSAMEIFEIIDENNIFIYSENNLNFKVIVFVISENGEVPKDSQILDTLNSVSITDGLSANKGRELNEKINIIDDKIGLIDSSLDNITVQLKKLNEETDYTNALQRAIDSVDGIKKYTIKLPQGIETNISTVTITKPNIKLQGGCINGSVVVNIPNYEGYMEIDNVRFKSSNPLIIKQLRDGDIHNCYFDKSDIAIYLQPIEGLTGQSIARLKISNNYFMLTKYNLKAEKITSSQLACADIHFVNNMCKWASIKHVDIVNVDGIIINSNTFFSSGESKQTTIEISGWSNWAIITGNNIFESGYEGVKLHNSQNFNISDNNFAWCGQYIRCGAIKIYSTNSSVYNCLGRISNNSIPLPSQCGIELDNVDYVDITNNIVQLEAENAFFKGTEQLDTTKLRTVYIKSTSTNPRIYISNTSNKPSTSLVNEEYKYLNNYQRYTSYDCTGNTVDARYDTVNLVTDGAVISSIINPIEGKMFTLIAKNDNVIVKHSSALIRLKNNVDFYMKTNSSLTLKCVDGIFQEVGRKESTKTNITLTEPSSTLILTEGTYIYACGFTSACSVTSFTVGQNFQEIMFISYNTNLTFVHSSTLILKGATNVNVPTNGIIKFISHGNAWREVSRNF